MEFDSNGQPTQNYHSGPFTEAGIDVNSVKLGDGLLRVEGQRIGLEFSNVRFEATNGLPERVRLTAGRHHGAIRIEIQSPPDGDFRKALDSIFAPSLASLLPAMPSYWQEYAHRHFLEQDAKDPPGSQPSSTSRPNSTAEDKPFHVGGNVTAPVVLHQDEPRFSDAARSLKFSGMVTVYLWVLPDGSISHLSITKPAGLGLDEQAVAAVAEYRFKPATRDSKPVTVDLYVDVNFQILNRR